MCLPQAEFGIAAHNASQKTTLRHIQDSGTKTTCHRASIFAYRIRSLAMF